MHAGNRIDPKITQRRIGSGLVAANGWRRFIVDLVPGLLLTVLIAALAFILRLIPGVAAFSPMIIAIIIGIAFHNFIGTPAYAKPGVAFSMRKILRGAIILLGLQLTFMQVAQVGLTGVAIIATTLIATFMFTIWFGKLIGVDRKLAELIAAGTSVCGASAVIATNTVTCAPDEDVAYAVACVTIFGSIAMFAYPLLPSLLHLSAHDYGLWAGASIHEIAQVVAAAFQGGGQSGEFGTIAKLTRVMMLAPLIFTLGFAASRGANAHGTQAKPPMPWFVFGFVALVGVNSIVEIPADAKSSIATLTTFLLSMALAAMGLETDFRKLKAKGARPFLLGFVAFIFIASFSLMLVKILG